MNNSYGRETAQCMFHIFNAGIAKILELKELPWQPFLVQKTSCIRIMVAADCLLEVFYIHETQILTL